MELKEMQLKLERIEKVLEVISYRNDILDEAHRALFHTRKAISNVASWLYAINETKELRTRD